MRVRHRHTETDSSSHPTVRSLAIVTAVALLASACSDGAGPAQPAADLSEELRGGNGPFIGSATPPDLVQAGFVQDEYVAAGTATSYRPVGELGRDGRWVLEPTSTADYRTRVLVRRPARAAEFSGTVVVEWLNVSSGIDADPDWASLEEELLRAGHAHVSVSAQLIGVEGGPVIVQVEAAAGLAGLGLKGIDPERYGSLSHPGDGFAFDIFTQVANAVRNGAGMGELRPDRMIAAGESQSAIALTTYYNGVQPLTDAFDGFFVHSRAFVSLPLVGPGEFADLAGGLAGEAVILRTDLDAPVLELQAEGDVTGLLNSSLSRQDDSDTFRLWEVAGTAHADAHLLGPTAGLVDCGAPINDAPMHLVAKAALRHLDGWIRGGEAPPIAPRLQLTGATPAEIARDGDQIALGGIRTPPVDVPVVVLSGEPGPNPAIICLLLGSTTPLAEGRIPALYSSRGEYERLYAEAADEAIGAGFVLEQDRAALLAFSNPGLVGN